MENKSLLKKIAEIILNKYNFALVYITCLLLRSVFFLQTTADIACKICLGWGILIVLYDIWVYKLNFFRINKSWFPLLICVAYGISVLVNMRYSLYGGIKHLLYLVIFLFVLFAISRESDKEKFMHYLKRNNDVFIVTNGLIALASIITFIFDIKTIYAVEGNQYKIGFWFNRLNGVCNSNMETILGLVSVGLVMINWVLRGKNIGKIKWLYIGNLLLQFIYYALSGSRAATICYAVMLAFFFVFYVFPRIKAKKGIVISALAVIILSVCVFFGHNLLVTGAQYAMKGVSFVVDKIESIAEPDTGASENNQQDEEISFDRVENFEGGDITNNRSNMWKAALKIIKQHPVFGIADPNVFAAEGKLKGNIDSSVMDESDMKGLEAAVFYFHNGFIQIALCGGIVLVVIFMAFALRKMYLYLKYLFRGKWYDIQYKVVLFIVMIVAALFVDNLVEVHLMFSGQDGAAALLWYLLGCGGFLLTSTKSSETEVVLNEKN